MGGPGEGYSYGGGGGARLLIYVPLSVITDIKILTFYCMYRNFLHSVEAFYVAHQSLINSLIDWVSKTVYKKF
jgi:hypothetical protein